MVFFVLLRLFSFAQVEVKGNLLKIQGDPLQNHPVYLFDRDNFLEETTTNDSGYYIFDVNDVSDILIVKTVGFCGFWETYSDTVKLDEGDAFEINFSICYNSTPNACNSNFIARPQSHFNFLFSSLVQPNEFINYQWDFGDGETATSAEVEHIY